LRRQTPPLVVSLQTSFNAAWDLRPTAPLRDRTVRRVDAIDGRKRNEAHLPGVIWRSFTEEDVRLA
jgi:hypothetical protein